MEKIFKDLVKLTEGCISSLDELVHGNDINHSDYKDQLEKIRARYSEEVCRRKTGEETGQALERFVNVMCNRDENKEFVEYIVHRTHRTLNQGIIGLVFDIIKEEAKLAETMRYDARNEASVMACKKLAKELEDIYLPFI